MAKASEIHRLRPPYLRVLAGGAHAPVETVDLRKSTPAKASTLMRAVVCLLALSLILSSALAAVFYLQMDRLLPFVPALVAALGILLALAVVLAGRAVRHVLEIEERAARRVHGLQSSTAHCSHGLKH